MEDLLIHYKTIGAVEINEASMKSIARSIVSTMDKIQNKCAEFHPSEIQNSIVPGVYMIQNKITFEGYIGESDDILKRWRQHMDPRYSNAFLHKDVEKYGWDQFRFFILEKVDGGKEARLKKESYWIQKLHGYCFNKGIPTRRKHIPDFGTEYIDSRITSEVYEAIQEVSKGMTKRQAAITYGISPNKFYSLFKVFEQNVRDYSRFVEIEFLEQRKMAVTEMIQTIKEERL